MFQFINPHLFQNRLAAMIVSRQLLQVRFQMAHHLMFGFGNKAQAPAIAGQTGGRTDAEGHGIKQRIEFARRTAQFAQPILAPGQMILFFAGGLLHGVTHMGQAGGAGLSLIKRLGTDFARVINAHQAGDMTPVRVGHAGCRGIVLRLTLGFGGARGQGAQGVVGAGEQLVQRAELAVSGRGHDAVRCQTFAC